MHQKTDIEVDAVLEKTITVFRYLSEKDVFERYYKGHLAKRLLMGRSVSDDAERGMLAKLKIECGYQFTQKLEGMFHDIKLSVDTMQAYRDHLAKTTVCFRISFPAVPEMLASAAFDRNIRYRSYFDLLANSPLRCFLYTCSRLDQVMQIFRAVLSVTAFW